MKLIPLTQGKFAQVDDEDFEWLNQWKWYYANGYAVRATSRKLGKQKRIHMHREIIHTPIELETDHIDKNKLNNCKSNLRFASRQQNEYNKRKHKSNSSGWKGVTWNKQEQKWLAQIRAENKKYFLGYYKNIDDAIAAYDAAAKIYHGEFASPNL